MGNSKVNILASDSDIDTKSLNCRFRELLNEFDAEIDAEDDEPYLFGRSGLIEKCISNKYEHVGRKIERLYKINYNNEVFLFEIGFFITSKDPTRFNLFFGIFGENIRYFDKILSFNFYSCVTKFCYYSDYVNDNMNIMLPYHYFMPDFEAKFDSYITNKIAIQGMGGIIDIQFELMIHKLFFEHLYSIGNFKLANKIMENVNIDSKFKYSIEKINVNRKFFHNNLFLNYHDIVFVYN